MNITMSVSADYAQKAPTFIPEYSNNKKIEFSSVYRDQRQFWQ